MIALALAMGGPFAAVLYVWRCRVVSRIAAFPGRVLFVSIGPRGWRFLVHRVVPDELEAAVPALQARLRAEHSAVRFTRRTRCWVRVFRTDPLRKPVQIKARSTVASVGTYDDGSPIVLGAGSVGVFGLPGSGKSQGLGAMVASLSGSPVCLLGVDCKRSELPRYAARMTAVATDPEQARRLLLGVVSIMRDRYESLETQGLQTLPLSESEPGVVLIVDEVGMVLDTGEREADSLTLRLLCAVAAQGRAVGCRLILASQQARVDSVPGVLRDLLDVRISMRATTRENVQSALGVAADHRAVTEPGQAWIWDHGQLRRGRFAWADHAAIVSRTPRRYEHPALRLSAAVEPESRPTFKPQGLPDPPLPPPPSRQGSSPLRGDRQRLLDACTAPSTIKSLAEATGLPEQTVRALAAVLTEDGHLTRTGTAYQRSERSGAGSASDRRSAGSAAL